MMEPSETNMRAVSPTSRRSRAGSCSLPTGRWRVFVATAMTPLLLLRRLLSCVSNGAGASMGSGFDSAGRAREARLVQASAELEQFIREVLGAYSRGDGEALLGMVADSPLVVIGTLEREWTEGRDELERMYAHEVLDPQ